MKRQYITVMFLFLLFARESFAQERYKGEVFGVVGIGWIHDDESYLGNGINIGGGLGLRLSDRIGVTFEADRTNYSRDFGSGVSFDGNVTIFSGNVHFYFPSGNVEPYLFAGAGVASIDHENRTPEVIFESDENFFSWQFGGGLRAFLSPNLSLRPEFRWTVNDFSFINELRGSVALAYHW